MAFHHDTPNSHVPGLLESLLNALSTPSQNESLAKSRTTISENPLYLFLSNT